MKLAPYLFAPLAFQLSVFSVSALDLETSTARHRQAETIPLSISDDWKALLGPRESDEEEEHEAIDRHEMMVSVAALRVPRKAWQFYEKGLEAKKRDDFDAALREFEAALKVYPDFAIAFEARGTTLLWQRKLEEAQASFLKAIALDPELFQAELGLGLVMNGTGQFEGAIEHLQRALYLNGECWQVRYALGRAYYGLSELLKAELNLKLARAWRPKHANVYLLLALVLMDEGKRSEALAEMEAFLTVSPDDPLAPEIRAKIQEVRETKAE
ncbi:MAG: hypothetical protein EHM23_19095 [Acidobacteria bacterium]|nr:MAG: hypothetical protein EHM23_19095 [Acidobacteriota bacterium]